jgi:two-component system OmpR family sensor kinase
MNGNASNLFRRLFAARSLRSQLLTRSLFILALLLLFIGLLQYFLMKEFIYTG